MKSIFENNDFFSLTLAKSLRNLKIIQENSYVTDSLKMELENEKIKQTEKKLKNAEFNFYFSLAYKNRLAVILKLCNQNKTQNEDWIRNLNFFQINLSKMIRWEEEAIAESVQKTKDLSKLSEEFRTVFNQRIETHRNLQS